MPRERDAVPIPCIHERLDFGNQLLDARERSASNCTLGDQPEPPFDVVKPRRVCRSEMHLKPFVLSKPRLHLAVLVRCVVIQDHVHVKFLRNVFIDQSQSMNLFLDVPTTEKLTAMHFHSWEKGLKTGIYYLRRNPIQDAQQFTVKPKKRVSKKTTIVKKIDKSKKDEEDDDKSDDNDGKSNVDSQPKLCLLSDPDCVACSS